MHEIAMHALQFHGRTVYLSPAVLLCHSLYESKTWRVISGCFLVGYLEGVTNLVGNQSKPNEVTFSWSPPFTLEGVPVLGYESYSTIIDSDETIIYTDHRYLNDSELTVAKPKANSSCIYVNVSVLATNSVGKGTIVNCIFYFMESKFTYY